jgi:hypothetical protein
MRRLATVLLPFCLTAVFLGAPAYGGTASSSLQYSREVALAASVSAVGKVQPPLQKVLAEPPGTFTSSTMIPKYCNARMRPQLIANPVPCNFGVSSSPTTIVLVGSSHAGMWLRAAIDVANRERIALKAFIYTSCVPIIAAAGQNAFRPADPRVTATTCATWNAKVGDVISSLHPDAVFVGSGTEIPTVGRAHAQWVRGMSAFCLLNHATNIEPCITSVNLLNPHDLTTSMLNADKEVSSATGAELIDVTNMLCTSPTRVTRVMRCPPVIDGRLVYVNGSHLTVSFTTHVDSVLQPLFHEVATHD